MNVYTFPERVLGTLASEPGAWMVLAEGQR
jgi:hypothetical protein